MTGAVRIRGGDNYTAIVRVDEAALAGHGGDFFRNADGRIIPQSPPYRPAYKDDIDDATCKKYIQQLLTRHVSREMYEENSVEIQGVEENNSYISRDVCEPGDQSDRVREMPAAFLIHGGTGTTPPQGFPVERETR